MADGSYKQFCPVAMATEILCSRWTLLLVRELVCGSTRFNDLRRGVPRMSPALLSKRLKDLEAGGVVTRVQSDENPDIFEYHLAASGRELRPIVEAIGNWGQRWIDSDLSLENLDATLLMWDMRRWLDPNPMPRRKSTIQFVYPDVEPAQRKWWLVVDRDCEVDLCSVDPGFDVDLFVTAELRAMTAVWMGLEPLDAMRDHGRIDLVGNRELVEKMHQWLGLSPFANVERAVA
ncbi:MAG: helix-turn-helix transcriptional regulator [Rhodobiaceae bacterium]|nr:helix-turn-helix transcriptional regulator [Rhodobiaceae bacterium]